jgi:RNA polymerase sigma-70 factor, ECF subfamily
MKNTRPDTPSNPARCPDFAEIIRSTSVDASLFAQIAECFSQRLETFAAYYCRDNTLGKDAFQEAMITALTRLDSYRGDSPIEPWLRRIVTRSCSRLRRGMKNDPSLNVSYEAIGADHVVSDHTPNPEWSTIMAGSFLQLEKEIQQLNEPDRSLLIAHDMHEEPLAELAERFSLSIDAIKSRLKRSRRILRDSLGSLP